MLVDLLDQLTVLTITLKLASDLSPNEVMGLYDLARQTGFPLESGYLERAHFEHNPTLVLAHQGQQLVGFQSYNTYRIKTPFFRKSVPFIYGGLAFQDNSVAGRGLGYRLSRFYMQHTIGRFFFLRKYAFAIRTPTPRLIQILAVQHQLVHYKNDLLTPDVLQFAQQFVRTVRRFQEPVDNQLVVHCNPIRADISSQWPTLFKATDEYYNELVYEAGLVRVEGEKRFITGKYLLVLGHSSIRQLLRSFTA
ncbi:hypothetical protein [Fibrivirga algicola]|uniref:GNAT family N-acetyltransferase n=1 Tax=Fibrivirga algicola TaxID=2950420 RepID=A0ABX0QJV4_9BACT|nr:hypothetical protein [Fibrivirga algicola]ARK12044.1 hypothetical protein A6C57_17860 [Fibrella sp. ES10-3-2-2]NID11128.1 hypothetical protein [Fibrivirga algicola]